MGGILNTMLTENVVSRPYFCIGTYIRYLTYPGISSECQIYHTIPSLFAINKLSGMKQGGKRFIEKWHV
jgi:hypothetical protein